VPIVERTWSPVEFGLLIVLTAFQVFETMPVSRAFTRFNFLWNLIRLLLCYLLIGFTDGIESSYYILLFWPIVSVAMVLKPVGTFLFTVLTIASYLSFLLFVHAPSYIPPHGVQTVILRSLTLMIMGCAMIVTVRAKGQTPITVN